MISVDNADKLNLGDNSYYVQRPDIPLTLRVWDASDNEEEFETNLVELEIEFLYAGEC